MIVEITFEEFKTFSNKEKFIFFFTIPGMCGLCTLQEKEYEKFNILNLIKVKGDITSEEGFMELGIDALPATFLFTYDGKPRNKKYGILYETQINQLLKEF